MPKSPGYTTYEGHEGVIVIASDDPSAPVVHVLSGVTHWASGKSPEQKKLAKRIFDLMSAT